MLDDCNLDYWPGVGPHDNLRTFAEATQALAHTQITNTQDLNDINLDPRDIDHIHALEWTFYNLLVNNILDPKIQQIIGAAITCLIGKTQKLGQPVYDQVLQK